MSEHNRNYGAMTTAREFWGGNNGFVTVVLNLPGTQFPVGTDYETASANEAKGVYSQALQLLKVTQERNLFRVAQAIGQRAVVVAVSAVEANVTDTSVDVSAVGGNVIAAASAGTPADGAVAVTFLIERADVYTKQEGKPGSTYAQNVDACQELADMLALDGFFESNNHEAKPDGTTSSGSRVTATGVKVKVFDALPVLK